MQRLHYDHTDCPDDTDVIPQERARRASVGIYSIGATDRSFAGMFVEQMGLRSLVLFVAFCVILGAAVWYARTGRRREWLWRQMHRSWGTRPKLRFHPLRRSDYLRTAGKAALLAVAFFAVGSAAAALDETKRFGALENWLVGVMFFGVLASGIALLAGLGQLWRAAFFRGDAGPLPFTVLSNDVRIGSASFIAYDTERGVFAGPFRPEPAFASVYPTVRLLSEAYPDIAGPAARRAKLDEYLSKRDALKLELLDQRGVLVRTGEISILDFSLEGGADIFRIDVEGELTEWEERGLIEGRGKGV